MPSGGLTLRVFPRRTSYTPRDSLAFVGDPPLWRPAAAQVRISCCFTWDIPEAMRLLGAWRQHYTDVQVGGPAFGSSVNGFEPGVFVKPGVTFTSRGCDKRCSWCLVPVREGLMQFYDPIPPGYIVQDDNFLACPRWHRLRAYDMLAHQKRAPIFAGGIEAARVTAEIADEFRAIAPAEVFLAADTEASLRPLERAVKHLQFLGRRKLRCYMLLAFGGETIEQAERRLEAAWQIGVMPFAQLYRPPSGEINYSAEWKDLARKWSRPAAMVASHAKPDVETVTNSYGQTMAMIDGSSTATNGGRSLGSGAGRPP